MPEMPTPVLSVVDHRARSAVPCLVFTTWTTIASVGSVSSISFSYSSYSAGGGGGGGGACPFSSGGAADGGAFPFPFVVALKSYHLLRMAVKALVWVVVGGVSVLVETLLSWVSVVEASIVLTHLAMTLSSWCSSVAKR